MNTNTNRLSARPRNLPLLALLLTAIALLGFAPQSARAGGEMPFHANFITKFSGVVEFPFLHLTVTGKGKATYLGTTSAFTDDQFVSLIDGSGTATYTLTGANGDTLVLALVVLAGGTINVEGGVLFSGSYTITGGTGRFNGATGSGVFAGSGLFLTETDGIGAFAGRRHNLVCGQLTSVAEVNITVRRRWQVRVRSFSVGVSPLCRELAPPWTGDNDDKVQSARLGGRTGRTESKDRLRSGTRARRCDQANQKLNPENR